MGGEDSENNFNAIVDINFANVDVNFQNGHGPLNPLYIFFILISISTKIPLILHTKFEQINSNNFKKWMDGWTTCDFTSFLTVFQSYQDDDWMIIEGCVQWNSVYG